MLRAHRLPHCAERGQRSVRGAATTAPCLANSAPSWTCDPRASRLQAAWLLPRASPPRGISQARQGKRPDLGSSVHEVEPQISDVHLDTPLRGSRLSTLSVQTSASWFYDLGSHLALSAILRFSDWCTDSIRTPLRGERDDRNLSRRNELPQVSVPPVSRR